MIRTLVALALAVTPVGVAAKEDKNSLTHGMVQMTLRVGETSQAEVLEAFGAPNISTVDGVGGEYWVYERHVTVSSDSSSGFSIGMLLGAGGGSVGGGAGLGFGKSKSKASQSSRAMTLVIKFGQDKRVADFKSRSSSF